MVAVTLPDGSKREFAAPVTIAEVAQSIGSGLAKAALAGSVDGRLVDLSYTIDHDVQLAIITDKNPEGLDIIRHSTAHLLAYAVKELFPDAQVTIGPVIENGFYYDFSYHRPFTPDDLAALEKKMLELAKKDEPVSRQVMPRDQAVEFFKQQGELYKAEIIASIPQNEEVSLYTEGKFTDLCRGPHVPSTGRLGHFALQKVAGAYWRGNEKGPMLQRIYGTAWESDAALKEHLHRLEEAAKRDHRRLANELDLLSFPTALGGGLAVWHPKGAIARKLMEDYSRQRHMDGGYQFVYTPHLANANLFETSGHLGFYADGMYPPMEMDNGTYYMKPMNCPMHCLIFDSRQRSYRELPLRLFELGNVYRYERAGTLHGLMRIRGFTQDDSHIFCTEEQLSDEIASLLDFVMSVLRRFGFSDFTANLSTKDPQKYVGSDDMWEKATVALAAALKKYGLEYKIKEGDAAFYGPKIDIDVRDAIGRKWQLSTIQLDFNQPERFKLEYIAPDGSRKRPVMLHRALFGSVERFFGVLLEHYAGAFPTWLSPVQVKVLPVANAHSEYANSVVATLRKQGFRAEIVDSDEQLGKRIRTAKVDKVPYVLVVGDDDVAAGTVGVNPRGGEVERGVTVDAFVGRIAADVAEGLTGGE
ncbi:MAG: threonyl-tRNA synthetase [Actinomycetota bacterium]